MPHVFIPRNLTKVVSALSCIIYLKIAVYLWFYLNILCQLLTQSTEENDEMSDTIFLNTFSTIPEAEKMVCQW